MSNELIPAGGAPTAVATVGNPGGATYGNPSGGDVRASAGAKSVTPAKGARPAEVQKYFANLPNGLVIGTGDQPRFDRLAAELHKVNAAPEVMHAVAKVYYETLSEELRAEARFEQEDLRAMRAALKGRWGGQYKQRMGETLAFFKSLPAAVQMTLESGTLNDGSFGIHTESMATWLWSLSQGYAVAVRAAAEEARKNAPQRGLEDEIAEIEKVMREDRPRYNRDERMRTRLRQLYEARENGATVAPTSTESAEAAELADLENIMRTDRKRWFGDERLQVRYRELVARKGR